MENIMNKESLVTVVIPVYNGANYLEEAIESVLAQTYTNIEIIVVNDGSDDNGETEKVALSYGEKIEYYNKENGGVASALNYGINRMRGNYFIWLSHDDVMEKTRVECQIKTLEKSNLLITACSGVSFNENGIIRPNFVSKQKVENANGITKLLIDHVMTFCGVMFDRTVFDKYGTFDEKLKTTQDNEFLFRIFKKERCACTNELLYRYRVHSEQGTKTIPEYAENSREYILYCLKHLSDDEMQEAQFTTNAFLYRIILNNLCDEKIVSYCLNRMTKEEKKDFHTEYLIDGDVWIYGAGIHGKRILFDLMCRNIIVKGFLDKNPQKIGKNIGGKKCFALSEYQENDSTIIIAGIEQKDMEDNLKKYGINSYLKEEEYINKMLNNIPSAEIIRKIFISFSNSDNK